MLSLLTGGDAGGSPEGWEVGGGGVGRNLVFSQLVYDGRGNIRLVAN